MKKVTELLEQHVQWVALGLGAIYLLWMVFSYLLTAPVSEEFRGSTVTAVSIDEKITEPGGPLAKLRTAMANTTEQTFKVEEYSKVIDKEMDWQGKQFATLGPKFWINSPTNKYSPPGPSPDGPIVAKKGDQSAPTPPAGEPLHLVSGRSSVRPAPAGEQPPVMGGRMPGGVVAPVAAMDKSWVVPSFRISMQEVEQAFQKAGIPAGAGMTLFLNVEIVREELDANNNWGNPVVIRPPDLQLTRLPGDNAPLATAQAFINSAQQQQAVMLQPRYFEIIGGDAWRWQPAIETPVPPELQPQPTVQPNPPAPKPNPRPPTKRPPRDRKYAPVDRERPTELAQAQRPGYVSPAFSGAAPPDPGFAAAPPTPIPPVLGEPGPVPGALFQPGTLGDVVVWITDDTVQPNHTYRYKMRYWLLNPVWRKRDAKTPADAAKFAVISPFSAPTNAITVSGNIRYFMKIARPTRDNASFVVCRWVSGRWHKKEFGQVSVGDAIGDVDAKTGIDFTTGATLVMVVEGGAVIADETGRITKRQSSKDTRNPDYERLMVEAIDVARLLAGPVPGTP